MKKDTHKQIKSAGLIGWVDERFPLSSFIKNHLTEYYAPKNFNFWYFFGALALFTFVIQILTETVLRRERGVQRRPLYRVRFGVRPWSESRDLFGRVRCGR